jgi:hypothetical protein
MIAIFLTCILYGIFRPFSPLCTQVSVARFKEKKSSALRFDFSYIPYNLVHSFAMEAELCALAQSS